MLVRNNRFYQLHQVGNKERLLLIVKQSLLNLHAFVSSYSTTSSAIQFQSLRKFVTHGLLSCSGTKLTDSFYVVAAISWECLSSSLPTGSRYAETILLTRSGRLSPFISVLPNQPKTQVTYWKCFCHATRCWRHWECWEPIGNCPKYQPHAFWTLL